MAIDVRQPALHMTWEEDNLVLSLAPLQGRWTAEQYLLLTDQTKRLIEFTDGFVQILPMPTDTHQVMLRFVFLALYTFLQPLGGTVLFAPLRLQVRADKFREPDILLVCDASDPRRQERYWLGADLVVEIMSPHNPERDTTEKRADYAEAGIPRGDRATSALLAGFKLAVNDVLDAQ